MLNENYKDQLRSVSTELDKLVDEPCFQKLTDNIINGDDEALLIYITKIGELKRQKLLNKSETILDLLYKYLGTSQIDNAFKNYKESHKYTLEELLDKLNEIIGLDDVKKQVNDLIDYNQVQLFREKKGLKRTNNTLHIAFLGNPGTGKTTVARIIGYIYKEIGLLSKGHFIEASRTDLIAEYQGQTAIKVKNLLKRAKGGVLFIDEAYSITENESTDSYGKECITELTKYLEDYREDLVVIVAGYTDLMEQFFKSNPGLRSRFNTFIQFADYSVEELLEIFKVFCKRNDYLINDEALNKVENIIREQMNNNNEKFANGRFIRNLFDKVIMNQSKRLVKINEKVLTIENLMEIKEDDILL
ncbi:AAA family ATPase [Mammaliicoccus sciuri]|uniref:AAA family ATPase n=1 Tax=Mammaliicoccus sciuri TaxID=1296 RepID=UPI003BA2CE3B